MVEVEVLAEVVVLVVVLAEVFMAFMRMMIALLVLASLRCIWPHG